MNNGTIYNITMYEYMVRGRKVYSSGEVGKRDRNARQKWRA